MTREGLASRFPIEELSIIGLAAVVKQLPMILRRIKETAEAVAQVRNCSLEELSAATCATAATFFPKLNQA